MSNEKTETAKAEVHRLLEANFIEPVRLCVTVCVGRHHNWAASPLGLGLSLYIVPHLLSIQQFSYSYMLSD
jgi:hypothetical protein